METSRTPISALIFDAGDIIVHKIPDNQVRAWYEISTHFHNSKLNIQKYFIQLYDRVRTLGSNFKYNHISIDFPEVPVLKISIILIEEYEIEKWWKHPDPQIFDTISQLWQIGYKIGILTDSALSSETIREVLPRLSPYVHKIVSSRDVGVMKPNKQMYSSMLSRLKISAHKAVFIAHDPAEIKGALESGLMCENFEYIGNLRKLVEVIQRKYVLA